MNAQPVIDPDDLRRRFVYDAEAGTLARRGSSKNAVCVKAASTGRMAAYVSLAGRYVPATHVIYALVHGVVPQGVRTKFADGDPTHLRLANLVFASNVAGAPGGLRLKPALLKLLAELGGRASSAALRRRGGFARPLAPYLRLLEAAGRIHAVGVDDSGGVRSLVWALGPGERAPEARLGKTRHLDDDDGPDDDIAERERARRATLEAIAQARRGAIANSVFAMGAQAPPDAV